MQLKYRGIAYPALITGVEAQSTQQMGVYRGQRFVIKVANMAQRRPEAALTYRGVNYTR